MTWQLEQRGIGPKEDSSTDFGRKDAEDHEGKRN
jgi:hypothetical protein